VPVIEIDELSDALGAFGYKDLQLPPPKKNFDFSKLHGKSILLMN
jgi:hypothetical protein